jgi:hypothetical protein
VYAIDLLTKGSIASIYPQGQRPALEVGHNFSFVLNIAQVVEDESKNTTVTLAPGYQLRRATDEETTAIKDVLTNQAGDPDFRIWQNAEPIKEGSKTTYSVIPKEQWRYFVIAFEEITPAIKDLERTFCIAPLELKIGFTLAYETWANQKVPILIYHPGRFSTQVRAAANTLPFFELTPILVNNIKALYEQYRSRNIALTPIDRLVEQMLDLDALPADSPLLFLGYFAVLESLLTHKPKETDTIDSITRQVKQKVILLDNRWQPRLDYTSFQATPDAIWKKMYHYRSDIAHGAEPDFKSSLSLLGNNGRALKLLKDTVKAVLRQTIVEPQLMLDLRNC